MHSLYYIKTRASKDTCLSDIVLLQKWLVAIPDIKLANWKAADMNNDGKLNVFNLCLTKRELTKAKNKV